MFGFLLGSRRLPAQPGIQPGKAELPADLRSLEGLPVLGEPDSLYILRPFYLSGTFYKFQPDTPAKQVIVELFPCFGMLQSCLDGIEDFVFHTLRSMEFLHFGLALALGVCQPVPVLKQFCGDFITLVIALGRDYLAVISIPATNIVIRGFEKTSLWCNVTGHSMEPKINHGDIIALHQCTLNDIQYGEIYAVVLDTIRTIKILRRSPDPDKLRFIPINTNDYDEQEFDKSRIINVFEVIGSISKFF